MAVPTALPLERDVAAGSTVCEPCPHRAGSAVSPHAHPQPTQLLWSSGFEQCAQSYHFMHKGFWLFLDSEEELFLYLE